MLSFFGALFAPLLKAVNGTTLAVVSFIEAIFFPIPPDVLLMPLVLEQPHNVWLFASIAAFSSVAGATVGYVLGKKGGRPLLDRYVKGAWVQRVETLYNRYDTSSVFVAGFTPIPYKVFALAAGVFHLSFVRFVVVSLISRFSRFALLAWLVARFGRQTMIWIERYFEPLTITVAALGIIVYFVWRRLRRPSVI